ncbi:MAG: DUF488 domain-containing protein [Lachnospiraceae bacterium]|nr:DUF488 domain-containing protein [Lachnospiraceae bacterium]
MKQLYTIGHSTYPAEHLLELLRQFEVQYVLDVRSMPYSRYARQYNANEIGPYLKEHGIQYFDMGRYFGARQPERKYYSKEGYLDFEAFRASELFQKGKENVKRGLKENNIALMCTEKNPIDCHRAIMVARGFALDGIPVKHILHDKTSITQEELDAQLLDKYFPDRAQLTLFTMGNEKSEEEYLIEAYRKRNAEIGFHFDSNKEGAEE